LVCEHFLSLPTLWLEEEDLEDQEVRKAGNLEKGIISVMKRGLPLSRSLLSHAALMLLYHSQLCAYAAGLRKLSTVFYLYSLLLSI